MHGPRDKNTLTHPPPAQQRRPLVPDCHSNKISTDLDCVSMWLLAGTPKWYPGRSPCPPVTFQLATKLRNFSTEKDPSGAYLVHLLCFTDGETEVLRGDGTRPRQRNLTMEKLGRVSEKNIPDKKSVSVCVCVCVCVCVRCSY